MKEEFPMKKITLPPIVGLGKTLPVIAVAAIFGLVGATQTFADRAAVPFKAVLSGTALWDGQSPIAECQGAGTASHLGLATSNCMSVFDLAGYMPYAACDGIGMGFGIPNVNTATLTAVNGDRLVLVGIDLACQIEGLRFHGTGAWHVNSSASTGRFAGATGTGTLEGDVDFAEEIFEVRYTGEIAY
jgi:hypothetical protein